MGYQRKLVDGLVKQVQWKHIRIEARASPSNLLIFSNLILKYSFIMGLYNGLSYNKLVILTMSKNLSPGIDREGIVTD